jgi:hypothetical protein
MAMLDEAADELERLRLTDEERMAIELAATWFAREIYESKSIPIGDTLRSLLERTK